MQPGTALAVPVVSTGPDATVGTCGAATCVAVLARATSQTGEHAVACAHLSSNDMQGLATATTALRLVYDMLTKALTGNLHGNAEFFLFGGMDDPKDTNLIEEYARLVGACQRLRVTPTIRMVLAGGIVPANPGSGSVDAFVAPNRVAYIRNVGSPSATDDGTEFEGTESEDTESGGAESEGDDD
jgi:hypothetical protein